MTDLERDLVDKSIKAFMKPSKANKRHRRQAVKALIRARHVSHDLVEHRKTI